jgi:hypothetical protein
MGVVDGWAEYLETLKKHLGSPAPFPMKELNPRVNKYVAATGPTLLDLARSAKNEQLREAARKRITSHAATAIFLSTLAYVLDISCD